MPTTGTLATLAGTETLTNKTLTTPVLGTPSSGTLSSCSALPISGLTASTSTALGVGSVELGHATDTTLARASAGVVTIEGVNIVTTSSTDTLTNKTLTTPKFADLGFIADPAGLELIIFDQVSTAVNELTIANAATTSAPTISATGDDSNISVRFIPKGTGTFYGHRETFSYPLSDESTALTTGVKYVTEPAPYDMLIEDVIIGVTTAGTGATLFTLDALKETSVNGNAWSTIFTTKPTIDASEFTSTTAAAAMSLTTTTWEKGRRMQLKIDTLDSNSLARGAKISLICHATAK